MRKLKIMLVDEDEYLHEWAIKADPNDVINLVDSGIRYNSFQRWKVIAEQDEDEPLVPREQSSADKIENVDEKIDDALRKVSNLFVKAEDLNDLFDNMFKEAISRKIESGELISRNQLQELLSNIAK